MAPSGRGRILHAEIDLARPEEEADGVALLDRQMQALDLVQRAARRGHRQRCRVDDRHARAAGLARPQHGDPRRLAAGDPLRVHARRHEHAVLGRLHRGAAERELHEPQAGPGRARRTRETVWSGGGIWGAEGRRGLRPCRAERQREHARGGE